MAIEFNTKVPQTATTVADQVSKMTGDSTKAKEVISKAVEVLAGANVKVTRGDDTSATGAGEKKTVGATGAPALDNPADPKAIEANLEKLIAYLQLDNEERQAEMAKDRINIQKDSLEKEHTERKDKINDSLKKMDDAKRASLASRIFGWLGAALAVIAAVVVTVVSGGTAAAFAIAGAVVAVGALVLNETGAMDKMIEGLAKAMEKAGMGKQAAQIVAALAINLVILAASLGCSIGGIASGAAGVASAAAKAVSSGMQIANGAVGLGGMVAGGVSTGMNYESQMSQADVKELEKIIQQLQQQLDESEEELNAIIEAIQNSIGQIAELLSSETDTQNEIANKISQMA